MTEITMSKLAIDEGRLKMTGVLPDGSTVQERLNAFALGILNEIIVDGGEAAIKMPNFGEGEGDIFTVQATNGATRVALDPSEAEAALLVDIADFEVFNLADVASPPDGPEV